MPLFYPKNLSWASCDRQIFGTSHSNFVNTLIHRFFTASSFATWPMSKYTLYGQNTNLSSLTWNWLDLLLRFLTLSKQWISVTNSQKNGKLVRNDFASWMNEVSTLTILYWYSDSLYHKRWFWENWLHFEHWRLNKVGNTGFLTFSGQNLAFLRVLSHWKHWDEWFRVARYQKRPGTSKGREVDVTQRTNGRVNRELCASEITLLWEEHKM